MTPDKQIKGRELIQHQQQYKSGIGPTVICDGLQTPENFGSILRVADAAGSQRIILLDSDLDLSNRKLSRLARSSDKHLSIDHYTLQQFIDISPTFEKLCALEITTQSQNLFESDILSCDAVIVGHESSGIREQVLALCQQSVHIPMFGTNGSMNISHALAVFLYEWRRQTTRP